MSHALLPPQLPDPVFDLAVEVFGGPAQAEAWLGRRAMGLDGNRPRDLMLTTEGSQIVRDFLLRIAYSVYS